MGWQPSYATGGELAAFTRISDSADDAQLELAIAASSRAIDDRCRRQFGRSPVAEPRIYTPRWSRSRGGWLVPIDDVATTTGLLVAADQVGDGGYATAVAAGAYRLRPNNAAAKGWPYTELLVSSTTVATAGPDTVRVTATWGWPGIPDGIRQACLMQASRLLSRRDSPFGVAGSPDIGSELRLLSTLDPDVAVAVEPYRRRVWAA